MPTTVWAENQGTYEVDDALLVATTMRFLEKHGYRCSRRGHGADFVAVLPPKEGVPNTVAGGRKIAVECEPSLDLQHVYESVGQVLLTLSSQDDFDIGVIAVPEGVKSVPLDKIIHTFRLPIQVWVVPAKDIIMESELRDAANGVVIKDDSSNSQSEST